MYSSNINLKNETKTMSATFFIKTDQNLPTTIIVEPQQPHWSVVN